MSRPTTLLLPISASLADTTTLPGAKVLVDVPASLVIVGANGSGKTRLGAWLELSSQQSNQVHRISAQKSLDFPDSVSPTNMDSAERLLRYGVDDDLTRIILSDLNQAIKSDPFQDYKRIRRWNQNPATGFLTDFRPLVTYLFTEDYEASTKFRRAAIESPHISAPVTKLDHIKSLWEQVLPHRQLEIGAGNIKTKPVESTGTEYEASKMSDGERACFYLIGQCIAVAPDSIIIIDEPEIHLHRIIQARLWNSIEQARPDCLFVYLTHDLEFAASRIDAKKIWLKSYDGKDWDWQEVPAAGKMPEELLLSVLGSRAPVLFTEGEAGGYEQAIFSRIYSGWTIMPCGNCEQVVDATQSFTNLKHLHGNECRGIIDRDYRDEHNVARLQAQGVLVLGTQEIENLMLDEAVLTAVLEHAIDSGAMAGTVAEKLADIKAHLFVQLARDQEMLTTKRASWEIEKGLRRFGTAEGALGLQALEQAVAATCALPVANIYQRIDQEFTRIITTQDYPALLCLYNNKGLAKRIGQFFNFREPFPDYFKRLLSIQRNEALVQALRAACPVLPAVATTV